MNSKQKYEEMKEDKKIENIKVNDAVDLSKPEGKQISMYEEKGFLKTNKKQRK